ncbi:aromatic hydrocarbon degradation protein [Sulfurimicrobium lacus]|uniref:Aromatic hydrocarbon degradation protein n=1 Tax=Sulfurimicrobium lacus TaxID=2715678 RepID=A0A6F8VA20_9PROT|nr:outer membrane protein transport protein [Sulfurimicrobium lacus]BCB25846.1 aromatic hydrocarbon degradation protein [Sulfurimicrobium lacus]
MQLRKMVVVLAGLAVPGVSFATNGMNMEGYGPIALGMGGASMAYDNGTAAMMNNPATLGLLSEGHRVDLALGFMGPNVEASAGGATAHSSADAFGGPAFGWSDRHDKLTYGVGVYGQGGMGTQYDRNSFMSAGTGLETRSELSVGRLLFPLTYNVTPDLVVGGSFDFVWAGLDLKMAMTTAQMGAMSAAGNLSLSPNASAGLGAYFGCGTCQGYFDFSNGSPFTGKAQATGYAGKLGFVYKVNPQFSVGASYHSVTQLGDLETDGAKVSMIDNGNAAGGSTTLTGKIKVINFQWPETYGVGVAYQANDKLMLVMDYKRINWSKVMKDFHMTFSSAGDVSLDMRLPQNWVDQDVFMAGFSYQASDALVLRAGVNVANNPVPDFDMHPLFPAIIKNHVTAGFGYRYSKASTIDFAYSYAPEVTVTNGSGIAVSHSQNNMQFIYSFRY